MLLLHQTPASSAELEPLLRHLAPYFTVLAPDMPGFGQSDPLAPADAEPGIDAFADALAGFLDALDLARVGLYGSHTGAILATRFACRHPRRVSALVPNGVLLNTAAERAELLANTLVRFVPDWSGAHLAWLWSRLRDQLVFYPYYRRDAAHRIEWPMTLAEIEAAALDLLDAGDNYRGPYRAVLDYDIAQDLPRLRVPTCLAVARSDALAMYVPQYPPASDRLSIEVADDQAGLFGVVERFLRAHAPRWATTMSGADAGNAPRYGLSSRMVEAGGGQWHLRGHHGGAGGGRPLLMLHDLGASARALDDVAAGLTGTRPVWVPDLPGHGLSDGFGATDPPAVAVRLAALLDALGLADCDLVAEGASAAVALALAAGRRGRRALLCNPRALMAAELPRLAMHLPPALAADSAGSHLLRAWGWLKDRGLYSPWGERSAATALAGLQPPRPALLQRALIDLLRARAVLPGLLAAALRDTTWERLADRDVAVLAADGQPAHRHLAGVRRLPAEREAWCAPLLAALG